MIQLSPQEVKKILKASKGKSSITAQEYRDAISSSTANNKNKKVSIVEEYSFVLDLKVINHSEYLFILNGRHLSTNRINSLGRRNTIRYKNSIKRAFNDYFYVNRFKRPKRKFDFAIMRPIFFNPRSRDDDSDAGTMKIIRDCIVNAGFLFDDDRKNLKQEKYVEVLSKEWKIEVYLKEEIMPK